MPKLTVRAIASASWLSALPNAPFRPARSATVASVRIAALPQAMSKPTPTTETRSSYAATPPIGMT